MKRRNHVGEQVENPVIDTFLNEIWALCEKHGLGISHEDTHGAFEIVPIQEARKLWLFNAADLTHATDKEEDPAL